MERDKPWLVSDSIDYLEKFLLKISNPKILEFGMGASTIWFSKNFDCELTSVEHNKEWFDKVSSKITNKNAKLILEQSNVLENSNGDLLEKSYSHITEQFEDEYFDLILIDGRDRVSCFNKSDRILKSNGLMVLDNSERIEYSDVFKFYSDKNRFDFIQNDSDEFGFFYKDWATTIWIK
jgi:predicted O-methyltransferase YrrM